MWTSKAKNLRLLTTILLAFLFIGQAIAGDEFSGIASYYADQFVGRKTASGELYSHNKLTCAHPTLPFGTRLKVTNPQNNTSVIVTVNDRGPFSKSRVLDLSKFAAIQLGIVQKGTAYVEVVVLDGNFEESGDPTSYIIPGK